MCRSTVDIQSVTAENKRRKKKERKKERKPKKENTAAEYNGVPYSGHKTRGDAKKFLPRVQKFKGLGDREPNHPDKVTGSAVLHDYHSVTGQRWGSGPQEPPAAVAVKTRRPASTDRTARAANFRRDLEAT